MNCWHCNKELRWCNDYDITEESESYSVETFFILVIIVSREH